MNLKKILLLLPFWVYCTCFAQVGVHYDYDTHGIDAQKQEDFYYEIPFEYNGQIMLKAKIGNETFDFAFDTGGYNMVTDAVKQLCGLEFLGEKPLGSANGLIKNTPIVFAPAMALGGLTIANVQAYQVNFSQSPLMECMVSGGFIGTEIIKKYIWQIDYPNRKIVVTNNLNLLPGTVDGLKLPVVINKQGQPYVMININGTYQYMLLDTGCSSLIMLSEKDALRHTGTAKQASLLGAMIETHNGRVRDTLYAFDANIGIQGTKLPHQPALYRKGAELNLLGNPIIKNYIVTLDFTDNSLYLKPIEDAPVPDSWNHFGFTAEYDGACVVIGSLIEGSRAHKAGLVSGDEITAINGRKITCTDYCDCREMLNNVLEASADVTLTVLKNGKEMTMTFKKEKIF